MSATRHEPFSIERKLASPVAARDPNERRKKILESLDLEPIGEYPDQSVAVFSRNGRKLVTIKDVDKLSFTRLLQIAGEPVFKHLDEKDPEGGTITLTDVRNALAICCRANIITADTTRGLGVWKTNRGNVVLVGKGEAGVWNGEEFRIVTSPKLDNILLDFSSGETFWPEDFGQQLANYDPLIGQLAVRDLENILSRWKWDSPKADDPNAPVFVITGLILATFIQTVFDFRPMISVTGESESGKTTLIQTIVSLFGNFGEKLANVTEAAIRQYIGTTARPLFLDEFEYTANRQKILELLRTSSDGSKQIRGTQDQKVRAYGLRHIVWMLAIEIDLQRAPDANRFLEFSLKRPTAEESGKLNLPNHKKLCELGEKLLLAVVWNAPEIIRTAEKLVESKIDGKNTREIQNFAAPAAAYACVMGYDPEDTLREFLTDVTRRETPSDQADILETLLMQRIRYQHYRDGLTEYAVGALIEMYYNHTDRREDIQEALMNFGIRVGNDPRTRSDCQREGVFFSKGALTELLKNTQWKGQDAKQILKRLTGVEETRARVNGAITKGVEIPLDYFEFKRDSDDF